MRSELTRPWWFPLRWWRRAFHAGMWHEIDYQAPCERTGWHELKCWPPYFARILDGTKTFELRQETDRRFAVGDVLWIREHTGREFTGRAIRKRVGYIYRWDDEVALPFLTEGTVVMGLIHDGPCDVDGIVLPDDARIRHDDSGPLRAALTDRTESHHG